MMNLRPLQRVAPGIWKSSSGHWTFLRHEGDPEPKRWFAYERDDVYPANEGYEHTTLTEVVDWASELE